ncbi:MAG: hypothetical protein NTV01_06860 [Bacteroidia bacterium]|nr:hypothetical protein [Bacteroidia bacterium]
MKIDLRLCFEAENQIFSIPYSVLKQQFPYFDSTNPESHTLFHQCIGTFETPVKPPWTGVYVRLSGNHRWHHLFDFKYVLALQPYSKEQICTAIGAAHKEQWNAEPRKEDFKHG